MQLAIVIGYLLMTAYFFMSWLKFSLRHPHSSPEDKFLSFIIFIITTALWPFVIPVHCVEMLKTRKLKFSTVIPVLVMVSVFSLALT
ncbi:MULTISPECIES: hypothetical protein [Nostocales]